MSQWGIRQELITTNFASFIKLPENVKKEKEIFSKEDIQKLEADGSQAAKLTLMMVYTGMRIGELFGLRTENVHETYVIGGEKTEAGRNRIIPIRSEGRKYFAEFKERAKGELLISGYAGQKVIANFRKRDYYPLLERLGISKKTPHATRHTFASWAVANNIKPELLQKMLGHADYSTTANIYEHFDIDQLIDAIDAPVTNTLLTNQKSVKRKSPETFEISGLFWWRLMDSNHRPPACEVDLLKSPKLFKHVFRRFETFSNWILNLRRFQIFSDFFGY